MKKHSFFTLAIAILVSACASTNSKNETIASLVTKPLNLKTPTAQSLKREHTSGFYRRFLKNAPNSTMFGDAMRRLADLELQTGQNKGSSDNKNDLIEAKRQVKVAIQLYETYLKTYPNKSNNDLILYQLAKAYELDIKPKKLLATLNTIVKKYPETRYIEEVQFRRGEAYFVLGKYRLAEHAYASILNNHPDSSYFEKSLYKYAWTRFKQLDYASASKSFIKFLDKKFTQGYLSADGPSADISRSNKELLIDVLRVTSLSFSYQQGAISIDDFFEQNGSKPFESILYNNLAELYLEKDRIRDAANTYLAFSKKYPTSSLAPKYHSKAIDSYKKGGFASLVLPAKISFVKQYGVNTAFWKARNADARNSITPLLKLHIQELAKHFHSQARAIKLTQKRKKKKTASALFTKNITQATYWYKTYIQSFPNNIGTENINFLLAEAHQDAGQYRNAIFQFEKTAYGYPTQPKQHSAAYAALLLYPAIQKKLQGDKQKQWQQQKISSAIRYTTVFPDNNHTPSILANTAEELFKIGDYTRAISTASKLDQSSLIKSKQGKKLLANALLVIGHSAFEMRNYTKAESSYKKLTKSISPKDKEFKNIRERLAASIYKQGELAKSSNKMAIAAEHFLRVGKVVPTSKLRATADYDAATIYINLENWNKSKNILEAFRKNYPAKHKLQFGITEKLAVVYSKSGNPLRAANEMIKLSNTAKHYTANQRRELLWDAAILYNDNKRQKTAKRILTAYVKNYPKPLEQSIEARQMLADFNKKSNRKRHYYWLREIIKADNKGGKSRTKRTQFLAAKAYMQLTLPLFNAYKAARLTIPLKRSLKKKKNLMVKVVKSYDNAMKYRVSEITTAATYYIAEIYNDFAGSLLKSQRPKKLNADELDQYNVLIEEQAFPFEEKAIDIHAANAERVKDNIYDKWVKLSISALSKLNPIRYAKVEKRELYVE